METWSGYNIGAGWGLWLPERAPVQDTDGLYGLQNIAVKNLSLYGGPLVIGETRSLTFNNIFVSNAAIYNFQDWNFGVMNGAALPTVDDIDSAVTSGSYGNNYYASKNLFQENSSIQGPCPDGTLRTVGCQGEIHYFMPGTPNGYSVEYYMKNFAGPCGGPLTLYNPSIDNEGTASPTLASFYVEFGPLVNGLTRETNLFTANNVVDGSTDAATPIFAIGNVGAGTVQMDRITYVPSSEPYVQQSIVSCANPNAYGVIDNLVPHPFNWATSGYERVWRGLFPHDGGEQHAE